MTEIPKPDIPIEEIPGRREAGPKLVSQEEFEKHQRILSLTYYFVVAAFIIIFIGFLTFLYDAFRFHGVTAKDYARIIEELSNASHEHRLTEIVNRLDRIENAIITQPIDSSKLRSTVESLDK